MELIQERNNLKEEYTELLHERLLRNCRNDPSQFIQYVLSWGIPNWIPMGKMHIRWQDTLSTGGDRVLLLSARDHSKTSFVAIGRILWELGKNPNLRIKLVCQSDDTAIKRLSAITDNIERNPRLKEIFPNLVPSDKGTWSRTKILVNRSIVSPDPSIEAVGILSTATGGRSDLICMDDPVDFRNAIEQPSLRNTVKEVYNNVWVNILEPDGRIWVTACLTGDSKILMEDGTYKDIINIKKDDIVWSFDNKDSLIKAKVNALIPQEVSEIYELKTKRFMLKATKEHPILTVGNNGIEWKSICDIKIGETILICKEIPLKGEDHYFPKVRSDSGKAHHKHPNIDNKLLDEEFMWLFGFLFGDGWAGIGTAKDGAYIAWAESIYPERNDKALKIGEKWFGKSSYRDRCRFIWNRPASRGIIKLGLNGGAKGKRIPDWVFKLNSTMKIEFLKGLLDADGWRHKKGNGFGLKLSNKGLIEDVKLLTITCGVRSSYPDYRGRFIQAPNSKAPIFSQSWKVNLCFSEIEKVEWNSLGVNKKSVRGISPLNMQTRAERVTSVTKLPIMEQVYDLQVEGTNNFIANGIITHNTPWHQDDLLHMLLSNPMYTKIVDKIDDDFTPIWPEKWDRNALMKRKEEIGDRAFARAFKMQALSDEEAIFNEVMLKNCETHDFAYGDKPLVGKATILMGVDLGSARSSKDANYTVIFTGAVIGGKKIPLNITRGKFKSPEFAKIFYDLVKMFNPSYIIIENNASQEAVIQWVREKYGDDISLPPIKGYFTGNQKMSEEVGLPAMAVEMEQRNWILPEFHRGFDCKCGYCVWLQELKDFPLGKFSDTVMASWLFREAVREFIGNAPRITLLSDEVEDISGLTEQERINRYMAKFEKLETIDIQKLESDYDD